MTRHWISQMPYHLSSSLAAEKALSITRAMHRLGAQTNYSVSRVRFRFRDARCLSLSASGRRFRQKRNNGVANWQCSAGAAGANAETVPAANKSAPRVSVRLFWSKRARHCRLRRPAGRLFSGASGKIAQSRRNGRPHTPAAKDGCKTHARLIDAAHQ